MVKELDLRGLKCPEPVIITGRELRSESELVVIVDDRSAPQNISRGLKKRGYSIDVEQRGDVFYLHIKRGEGADDADLACVYGPTVVFMPSDSIGRGDDELGAILSKSIIYSFLEVEPKPDIMIFMNSGVKLAVEGSPVLEDLKKLNGNGVEVLVCGTCLDYLGLKERLAVGEVSNAYTIAETLLDAGKVIRF